MLSPTSNDDMAIPPGDLQFIQQVGSGGYGEVWKGKWRGKGGGVTVAIKKVPVNKLNTRQQREILVEVDILYLFSFSSVLLLWLSTIYSYQIQTSKYSLDLWSMLCWTERALDCDGVHGRWESVWVASVWSWNLVGCTSQVIESLFLSFITYFHHSWRRKRQGSC